MNDHPRDDARIDLSPLDTLADDAALGRHVRRVRAAAARELARRQSPPVLWDLIALMRRPILATAGVLAVVTLPILMSPRAATRASGVSAVPASTAHVSTRSAIGQALGIPEAVVEWTAEGARPGPAELVAPAEDSR